MDRERELMQEREYTARVQRMLLAVIEQADLMAGSHSEAIRAIVADAWEDLRMRPTELSGYELQQLSGEVDRFIARRDFSRDQAERSRRMLMDPFFARVDFTAEEEEKERIVIGLYSLKDPSGELLVHDWRAPVCSLFYDSLPGPASYRCPAGEIAGTLTLKRQYRMEKGRLVYYVDTGLNIDDRILLDILSSSAQGHMRQIANTIQREQNAAIREEGARVLSVVGTAGSGKTSVAMHRAAYLMYRRRDVLDASKLRILSPSETFSDYVSTVLPELGEENIPASTLYPLVKQLLPGQKVERPEDQLRRLMDPVGGELRRKSVRYKCGPAFAEEMEKYIESFAAYGPDLKDLWFEGRCLVRKEELRRMYRDEFTLLKPAQRLMRVNATLESRFESFEKNLYDQYERQYSGIYEGRTLRQMARMAVSQRLQPLRLQIRDMMDVKGDSMLRALMRKAPGELRGALRENAAQGIVWWEDAIAEACMRVRLGFSAPDKSVLHLLVDEAQDLSEAALRLLDAYYPNAGVTLLGDPMQRTCPGMEPCRPEGWGACFGEPGAPLMHLTRCYRSSLPIARFCDALLPEPGYLEPFGRDGEAPRVVTAEGADQVRTELERLKGEGITSIAVVTRTQRQAEQLSGVLEGVYRLDGGDSDPDYENGDTVLGCYHMMKGMEFDAVLVVWEEADLNDEERRRLYTACSRALHRLTLVLPEGTRQALAAEDRK